eukprot:gnl/MRDRNA2_/MRDRNA2_101859_c0_seq1.p1 gnl/MRDRNA2_/MRDRNA2_101859_c0~~gnl/MRDRNA2_/MRDRNA2_101859_c0_seq1.p1  ORF type:complete len:686 (-),score=156.81 gnl/MRDRNA2_/MRDRNA2_101859_c0_seq1:33-2090(-)
MNGALTVSDANPSSSNGGSVPGVGDVPTNPSSSNSASHKADMDQSDVAEDTCDKASSSRGMPTTPTKSLDAADISDGLVTNAACESSTDAAGSSSGVINEPAAVGTVDQPKNRDAPMKRERQTRRASIPESPGSALADGRPRKQQRVMGSTRTSITSPAKAPRDMSTEEQRSTEQESDDDELKRELKRVKEALEAEKFSKEKLATQNAMLKQQLAAANNILQKAKDEISNNLVLVARVERDKARAHLTSEELRVGKWHSVVPLARHGTWKGGTEEEQIEEMRGRIKEAKAAVDKLKRSAARLEKQQRVKADNADGDFGAEDEGEGEDVTVIREVCSQRSAYLSREEAEIQKREAKLRVDRSLHWKQSNRLNAEQNSNFRHYPLLHDRYQLLNLIGKGGFSEVFKALDLQTMTNVAVKIHELDKNMTDPQRQSYIKRAMREHEIQKSLKNSRIVHLSDCFPISNMAFATVLELCEGDTLDQYMKKNGGGGIQEKDARGIIIQILSGLRYMNTNGNKIIHYDLKPGNLFFHGGEVKICDFGLSKIVSECHGETIDLTSQGAGTYWYLPPECLVESSMPPKISNKVDVWSTGVIFYELLFGKRPFGAGQSQEALLRSAAAGNAFDISIPQTPKISSEAKELILRMLTTNRESRPDVLEIFNDPYFKNKQLARVQQSQLANEDGRKDKN